MPLFNGRKWAEYPAYPYRHDFIEKPAPQASAPQAVGLDQRILYVPGEKKLLRGLRGRLFFTAFVHYEEGDDVRRICTREDLCAAFKRLVSIFQELHNAGRMLDELPKLEPELAARLTAIRQQLAQDRLRALWAAELFGQYLAFLSDAEGSGKMPADKWRPYAGDVDATHTTQQRMQLHGGQLDDYAFRVAAAVNRRKHKGKPAYVAAVLAQIEALLADILKATTGEAAPATPRTPRQTQVKYAADVRTVEVDRGNRPSAKIYA